MVRKINSLRRLSLLSLYQIEKFGKYLGSLTRKTSITTDPGLIYVNLYSSTSSALGPNSMDTISGGLGENGPHRL